MYQVSVLVPVYRVEQYIERCARSLFEQTYANLEYIFVDDCSPDNSIAILKKVLEDYPARQAQVRIIRHERNRGLSAARNTAINAAQGLFITHVDSDDYLDRDAIRLLVDKQVETGADIVTGNFYIINPNGIKKVFEPECKDKHEMLLQAISARLGTHVIWQRLIHSSLYKDYNIRPKEGINVGEDRQQIARLVYYANKVAKINDHIYYYNCINKNSYVSMALDKSGVDLWEQSIKSATIIEDFFSDKEQEYRKLSHRAAFVVMKTKMSLASLYGAKEFFEKTRNEITTHYADCFNEIGWNNPLLRVFMCNYTLNGIYRRFLNAFKSVHSLIVK